MTVVVGAILFWSMVEDNAALIAACLPTMRFLVKHGSLETMIRSVRSKLSLASGRGSSKGGSSRDTVPSLGKVKGGSSQEIAGGTEEYHLMRLAGESTVDTRVENERHIGDDEEAAEGGIHVTQDLRQVESYR